MDRQRQKVNDPPAHPIPPAPPASPAQPPSALSAGKARARKHAQRFVLVAIMLGIVTVLLTAGVAAWIDAHESRASASASTNANQSASQDSATHQLQGDGAAVLPLPPNTADTAWGIYLYDNTANTWQPRLDTTHPQTPHHLPDHLVILVHGLDEPGGIWNDAAPALASAGLHVARFDYPNDQAIALSADLLAAWLAELQARGVQHIDIVGHSMGGLVIRDVLTRDQPGFYRGHGAQSREHTHPGLPDARRLITVATPHAGAELARYRALAELREHATRVAEHASTDFNALITGTDTTAASLRASGQAMQHDGDGQAGRDLLPNSAFLSDLNARPWPKDVIATAIIGIVSAEAADAASWITQQLGTDGPWHTIAGDGIVSQASATPGPPVTDTVVVSGTHRGILVRWAFERSERTPPAVNIIVDRLTSDESP